MAPETATLERQLQLYKGLVEVAALINGITEKSALLPAVLEVARRVFRAEAASLFLVGEGGELSLAAARGGPQEFTGHLVVPRGRGIAGWVAEHGEAALVPDVYQDPRFFADFDRQTGFRTRSLVCVPLRSPEKKVLGVIQIINPAERASFDEIDREAFCDYGTLAATAIDKVRSLERQREQQRVAQEFAWAREIQASFLPQALPARADLHFAAAYRPAATVGGDFYDVLETGPDEVYFVIGDVSGKGVPAALLMAQALSTLRLILQPGVCPAAALARWNAMLSGHTVRGMFITALLGRALVPERRLQLANAGHGAPLRVTAEGGVEELSVAGAPPLGVLPAIAPECREWTLGPREWVACSTDGLAESFDPERRQLGREGVAALLRARFRQAGDVIDALTLGEQQHRRYAEPHDDLTLLVFGFQ